MAEKENNRIRVQFDFTKESDARLEELKRKVDASTKAEVLRNALKLYEWFVDEVSPEYVLNVEDKEGNNVFRIPAKILLA